MIYETDPSPLPLSGLLGLPPYRAIGDYVHAENAKAQAVNSFAIVIGPGRHQVLQLVEMFRTEVITPGVPVMGHGLSWPVPDA